MIRTLALTAVLWAGCSSPPPEPPPPPGAIANAGGEVLATVNGKTITTEMAGVVERGMPPQQRAQLEQMKEAGQYGLFVDRIVMGQMLYEQALEKKLHEDPKVKLSLAMAARDALASEYINQIGEQGATEEKLKAAYDERKVRYKRDQVKARHILVKELDKANELKTQLAGGGDFAKLATDNSVDRGSAQKGGDLGWFATGRMVPAFEQAAFAAQVGEVVGPVETQFGFHLIQVQERRDTTPFEEVRDELREELIGQAIEDFLKTLKDGSKVEWSSHDWVKGQAAAAGGAMMPGGPPGAPPAGAPPAGPPPGGAH